MNGTNPAFRENLKSAVRRYAEGVNSSSTFAGIYGLNLPTAEALAVTQIAKAARSIR